MKTSVDDLKALIVSDNHILRSGLIRILETQSGITVLGEMAIANGATLDGFLARHPDVVLLDLDPQSRSVLSVISRVKKQAPKTVVLVLNDLGQDELVRKAIDQGAAGVVLKMQPPSALLATIASLCERNHKPANRHNGPQGLSPQSEPTRLDSLTGRERDIVGLIAAGLKNKEIAGRLCISDITVRHHLTSIFSKLRVSDRQKLLLVAHEHGLTQVTVHRPAV